MLSLLKSSELPTYAIRADIDDGDQLAWIKIASRLADAYCGRSLAYARVTRSIRLSDMGVGYLGVNPILRFDPVDTDTGLRVKPLYRSASGGQVSLSAFEDVVIPADIEDLLDPRTGRVELERLWSSDFGRRFLSRIPSGPVSGYHAVFEVISGYFPSTTLTEAQAAGQSTVKVKSTTGIIDDVTYLTVGDNATEYLVTNINGLTLTISPALAAAAAVKDEASAVIPDDLKVAAGMIIEDLLTYQPNTIRQSEKLDVITDVLTRTDAGIIPPAARAILDNYKAK